MRLHTAAAVTLATGLLLSAAPAASAAPAQAGTFEISCDNGQTYDVWVNGRGTWTPAHVIGSTTRLIPLAFTDNMYELYDPEGTLVETGSEPDEFLPGPRRRADAECMVRQEFPVDDGYSVVFTQNVSVRVVG